MTPQRKPISYTARRHGPGTGSGTLISHEPCRWWPVTASGYFMRERFVTPLFAAPLSLGGLLTEKDFADHTTTWVEPISTDYRGYSIYELPPNGQGVVALQMLNVLEGYDLAALRP